MWEKCLHWKKDGDDQQAVVLVGEETTCRPRYEERRAENMPQRAEEHDHENVATKHNLNHQKLDFRIPHYMRELFWVFRSRGGRWNVPQG